MHVLGFDPGYDRLGIALVERSNGHERVCFADCLYTDKTKALAERLYDIGVHVGALIEQHTPDAIALETLYFNTNQKTAMAVAEARGILLFLAGTHECPIYEYTPQQIKVAVTGYGRSSKAQVMDMVTRLTGFADETAVDDVYDAIAVSITCLVSER